MQRLGSDPPGPFEDAVGYARVVRAGPHVWVSGCTSVDAATGVVVGDTPGEQMERAIANLVAALARVGATPADVVRTRMYVTDASRWPEVGRAHAAVFAAAPPAAAMLEVRGFVDPRMLVEIEADAYVEGARGGESRG